MSPLGTHHESAQAFMLLVEAHRLIGHDVAKDSLAPSKRYCRTPKLLLASHSGSADVSLFISLTRSYHQGLARTAGGVNGAVLWGVRLLPFLLPQLPVASGAAIKAGAHEAQQALVHICQAGERQALFPWQFFTRINPCSDKHVPHACE